MGKEEESVVDVNERERGRPFMTWMNEGAIPDIYLGDRPLDEPTGQVAPSDDSLCGAD